MILAGAGNTAVEVMRFKPPVFVPPHELWAHLNEKRKKKSVMCQSQKKKKKKTKKTHPCLVLSQRYMAMSRVRVRPQRDGQQLLVAAA